MRKPVAYSSYPRHLAFSPPLSPLSLQDSSLPAHVVSGLLRQLKQLAQSPPEGVKFVPGEGLEEIFADIEGPGE